MSSIERFLPVAGAAALIATAVAGADFVRFDADQYIATSNGQTYHVIDVYAIYDSPSDRTLNCFDVSIDLVGALVEIFYHASEMPAFPASAAPMIFFPNDDYEYDTFVTIGSDQGELTNGTILDPDFDDEEFVTTGVLTGGGWYNMPPQNGNGDAGSDLSTFLGRFSITEADWQSGARVTWEGVIGYTPGNEIAEFGIDNRVFFFQPSPLSPHPAWEDVDGDHKGDLIWHNAATGALSLWRLDALDWLGGGALAQSVPAGWQPVGAGDLDGDGDPDLVFRDANMVYHAVFIENSQIAVIEQISNPLPAVWENIAIADIDGDGRSDLVFRNVNTSEVRAWLMDGKHRWKTGPIKTALGFTFVAAADLDGDGRTDLLWRAPTGIIHGWLLDGLEIVAFGPIANAGAVPANWQAILTGDLNGDGREDLVWRGGNSASVSGWLMDGLSRTAGAPIVQNVPPAWQPLAMLDLDGDGDDDMVWFNIGSHAVNGWIMDGLVRTHGGFIRTAAAGWTNMIR